jgi:hypothetical protein
MGAETIVPVFLDPVTFPQATRKTRRMDGILLRTLNILMDETVRNDFKMSRLINIGIKVRDELLDMFAHDPRSYQKIKDLFQREEYLPLLSPTRRVISLVPGLRPDESLTDNIFRFEPARMKRWIGLGEVKAREVILKAPFSKSMDG